MPIASPSPILTAGASITGSTNSAASGWLVGGDIERAFAVNWSGKVEYDHLGLNSRTFTVPLGAPFLAGNTFITGGNNNLQMLMVGLNYRFNWGYPVARLCELEVPARSL